MCSLTETHRIGKETVEDWSGMAELDEWRFINSGMKKKAYGGIGLLISPEVQLVDDDWDVIDPG